MSVTRASIFLLAVATATAGPSSAQAPPTDVIILGVLHSGMLVAESYQPAVFRAYFERVQPSAICIERAPEEFARGSHYEFTYEIQSIAVPYARENGIPLCPFDWLPSVDDQVLAFGIDLAEQPFVRGPDSWSNFVVYEDSSALTRDLFFAESAAQRESDRAWYMEMAENPRRDFPRRLFLYRTFLQGMRIARAAREYPGGRLLVLVGSMHKDDLEQTLGNQPGVRIVAPTEFGAPSAGDVESHVRLQDLAAVATFNLLGAQSIQGVVDFDWMRRTVERLEAAQPGPETQLLRTRLDVLTDNVSPAQAAQRYHEIRGDSAAHVRFTWDGVLNRRRLDSFADPFGNLTIAERAALEEARELLRAGHVAEAAAVRAELEARLSPLKAAELGAYWSEWISPDN